MTHAAADHWNTAYAEGDATKSWTTGRPTRSLRAVTAAGAGPGMAVIDIGGGSSPLAAELLDLGITDVTVLDLSAAAVDLVQRRMGARASEVDWIVGDVLAWRPRRRYDLWHDRAALHFFTDDDDRARYGQTLQAAIAPGGTAIIATFAVDGPERCSGLPARRSSAADVMSTLGPDFTLLSEDRELHRTPAGSDQAFTWVTARRR
ncbi:class I SAM-dependent methyltransferase [Paraconexibacter antarcticus]|uniref:Class I SAM-dependent methyltransferase n=1 Tax=Paraconexibacter antarcticus TaxID=2949664 RepID=A0ABY5DZX0_9ACTN|nr:class I SAM-dependent methyltransferase [Paraconexibacter antarcticus]UTI66898.1 class I SAM-dependent methyltransferase [Paraconexibacter antarcticus]